MGRDTSINVYDKESYNKLTKLSKEQDKYMEDVNNNLIQFEDHVYTKYEEQIDSLHYISYEVQLHHWGKSDCDNIVRYFRKHKNEDGDLIITKEIFEDMKINLQYNFTLKEFETMGKIIKRKNKLLVYNTNG